MRVLFAAQPSSGHIHPLVGLAQALAEGGHEILFAVPASGVGQVEAAGFRAVAVGIDWDDAVKLHPEAQARYYDQPFIHNWFYSGLRPRTGVPVMLELFERWRPDVLVHESLEFGAALAGELTGLPHAVVEISAWNPQRMRAEFGAGLAGTRAVLGLAPDPDQAETCRYLSLAFYPPDLEPLGAEPVKTRHYFQVCSFDGSGTETLPDWVRGLARQPTIYATLGTAFNRAPTGIFEAILVGLRDENLNLILTVGRDLDPASLGSQPSNIHIERYIPQHQLLPHCDIVIAHGGRSTFLQTVSYGLPMVLIPIGADQPYNAELCVAKGLGVALELPKVSEATVRQAALSVLHDPSYQDNVRRVKTAMQALPGLDRAVQLLERLSVEKQPMLA